MTEAYTAPTNGHEIAKTGTGGLRVSYKGMDSVSGHEPTVLKAGRVQSLREFFQDERDKELGRWRDPEYPSYAVYELTRDRVRVVDEDTGNVNDINRDTNPTRSDHSPEVAKAYFDAHPVKKPWHGAKPGEVWEVTVQGDRTPTALTVIEEQGLFFYDPVEDIRIHVKGFISLARRIWPEN